MVLQIPSKAAHTGLDSWKPLSLSLSSLSLHVFALYSLLLLVVVLIGSGLVVHKVVWCLPELEPFFLFFFFIDDVADAVERCRYLLH